MQQTNYMRCFLFVVYLCTIIAQCEWKIPPNVTMKSLFANTKPFQMDLFGWEVAPVTGVVDLLK